LRIAGDPLHLPLLQTAATVIPPQLAFLPPEQWAEQLLAGCVDAVLVSVAGDARRDPKVLLPPLQRRAVEAIGLGARALLLLHHPAHLQTAHPQQVGQLPCLLPRHDWQRRGYLLPTRQQLPLLHRALEGEGQLPLHCWAASDHRSWLQQLAAEPLLLPADLTLLTLPHWREAGLVVQQPLSPLTESLWLLLRRGEALRPQLAQLLQWWGGSRSRQAPLGPAGRLRPAELVRWPWWRRPER
jgi:hypothetical protein